MLLLTAGVRFSVVMRSKLEGQRRKQDRGECAAKDGTRRTPLKERLQTAVETTDWSRCRLREPRFWVARRFHHRIAERKWKIVLLDLTLVVEVCRWSTQRFLSIRKGRDRNPAFFWMFHCNADLCLLLAFLLALIVRHPNLGGCGCAVARGVSAADFNSVDTSIACT